MGISRLDQQVRKRPLSTATSAAEDVRQQEVGIEGHDKSRRRLGRRRGSLGLIALWASCGLSLLVLLTTSSDLNLTNIEGRNMWSFLLGRRTPFPRSIQFDMGLEDFPRKKRKDTSDDSNDRMFDGLGSARRQHRIVHNSAEYGKRIDTMDEGCEIRHKWQNASYPTCNSLHEFDYARPLAVNGREHYRIVGKGYWRDVWIVSPSSESNEAVTKLVYKSMRQKHHFTARNFDRMRRDAMTMERLTYSKYIVDIYGFCGTSSLSEFAEGGDIPAALWPERGRPEITQLQKLHIATQGAIALATLHNVDVEGEASIAHTDIAPGQFLSINGVYKLNDFNRARFIPWSKANGTACTYKVGNNPGKNRSPEEYKYLPQTEKVDVYSFGNILYMLLQGEYPFYDFSSEDAQEKIKEGYRPTFYVDVWNSTDPITQALKEAMLMCHYQDPVERTTARNLEKYLKARMRELDPGELEKWESS